MSLLTCKLRSADFKWTLLNGEFALRPILTRLYFFFFFKKNNSGNKLIGVQVLQNYLGAAPDATVHVGDQFLSTGNDFATRSSCCTLWIVNPEETQDVLEELTPLLKFPAAAE